MVTVNSEGQRVGRDISFTKRDFKIKIGVDIFFKGGNREAEEGRQLRAD